MEFSPPASCHSALFPFMFITECKKKNSVQFFIYSTPTNETDFVLLLTFPFEYSGLLWLLASSFDCWCVYSFQFIVLFCLLLTVSDWVLRNYFNRVIDWVAVIMVIVIAHLYSVFSTKTCQRYFWYNWYNDRKPVLTRIVFKRL